ncbi:MAG: L-lysine 6-transaminase [Acidimicrobiales bacterium]|jgi:L-lysine 6-transaminase
MSPTHPASDSASDRDAGLINELVAPASVHEHLSRHVLADGYKLVVDLERSHGSVLVDARAGTEYLDCYTFFASLPIGYNHPDLVEENFLRTLGRANVHKPANPDAYSVEYAEFVDTFARVLGDPALPHLFFVEGGALAVENALKVAFDWKSRRNDRNGRPERGDMVMHLQHAFHGRSGYTLSLTNTEPIKTERFPKFDWPRISSPAQRFPLADFSESNRRSEDEALSQAVAAFEQNPHQIACFVCEPIQAEGGDRHLSARFLGEMQDLCKKYDALFVLDEVQTGVGVTGSRWMYEGLSLEPDVVAFAKKVQVGGVMAGRRVDEEPDNVFQVSGRISSTWGGGLSDMVRSTRILEIIERDGLIDNAAKAGHVLLGSLEQIATEHPSRISNARGSGLLCAVDLPSTAERDRVVNLLREDEHVIVLPCGDRSVRFRPGLIVTEEEVTRAADALGRVVEKMDRGN